MPLTNSVLAQTFSEVLANLAFMFTADEPREPDGDESLLEVTIGYEGPARGRLCVRCPVKLALLLSANLLGLDSDQDAARLNPQDALKELMNVVCGQLVTTLHGSQGVFQLSIPEVREIPPDTAAAPLEGDESVSLCVEGYEFRLAYTAE